MADYDWSRFSIKIPFDNAAEEVFNAWTTPSTLESWFLRSADFTAPDGTKRKPDEQLKVGDTYQWKWHGWSDDVVETGEIIELTPGEKFAFVFGKAGIVTVTLKQDMGKTVLQLVQSNIPTDPEAVTNFHLGCMQGWTFYLANLKSILMGGKDLRNKDVNMQGVMNA